jgi:hypothetical protein
VLRHIHDVIKGKTDVSTLRSGHWHTVRKHHLENHPVCEVCGGKDKLQVHHKRPFHMHPELELEPSNLITLCEGMHNGLSCHLLVGHLGNFKSINVNVEEDAKIWNSKLKNRPLNQNS